MDGRRQLGPLGTSATDACAAGSQLQGGLSVKWLGGAAGCYVVRLLIVSDSQ